MLSPFFPSSKRTARVQLNRTTHTNGKHTIKRESDNVQIMSTNTALLTAHSCMDASGQSKSLLPRVIDISAFHYDDRVRATTRPVTSSGTSTAQSSYFSRIPFHREGPDGFNNDIFGWLDGGNGSVYVDMFRSTGSDDEGRGLLAPPPIVTANTCLVGGGGDDVTLMTSSAHHHATADATSSAVSSSSEESSPMAIFFPIDDLLLFVSGKSTSTRGEGGMGLIGILEQRISAVMVPNGGSTGGTTVPCDVVIVGCCEGAGKVVDEAVAAGGGVRPSFLRREDTDKGHAIIDALKGSLRTSAVAAADVVGHQPRIRIIGMLLGAICVPEEMLFLGLNKRGGGTTAAAATTYQQQQQQSSYPFSLYIAPLKMKGTTAADEGWKVAEGAIPTARMMTITPARALLFVNTTITSIIADVTQTVVPDAPFYPGGQPYLCCPAAAAMRARALASGGCELPSSTSAASTSPLPPSSLSVLCGCDVGTHIDSPQHFYADKDHYTNIVGLRADGVLVTRIGSSCAKNNNTSTTSTTSAPAMAVCSELVAPVVVVDVRKAVAANHDYLVSVEDVKRALVGHFGKGEKVLSATTTNPTTAAPPIPLFVAALTGWCTRFEDAVNAKDPRIYQGIATDGVVAAVGAAGGGGDGAHPEMHFPGFSPEAASYILSLSGGRTDTKQTPKEEDKEAASNHPVSSSSPQIPPIHVVGIGIDTLSLDCGTSTDFMVHQIMLGKGNRYQVENMDLRFMMKEEGEGEEGEGHEKDNSHRPHHLNCAPSEQWWSIVLPIAVDGAYEAMGRVSFVQLGI